ncbi:MAG: metallophosphoesterase [Clostridiales bacterium]|nr:metallophosphoesterase [Clostridiales bacterium]
MARRKHGKKASFLKYIFLFAFLLVLVYPFLEARNITVDEQTLLIPSLSKDLQGLKIVYVSDIHQGTLFSQTKVNDLVAKINEHSPDLVLLGGDYGNTTAGAIVFFQNLPAIQANLGTFAVLGNHDHEGASKDGIELLKSAIRNTGIVPLVNETREIRYKSASFFVSGIDDYVHGSPDISAVSSSVSQEDFVIFLTHTPDAFPEAFNALDKNGHLHWFDLGLAGHTHGGQVTFFGTPLFRNYNLVSDKYLTGWLQENRAHTLVSNGVGTVILPARFFAKPQIHVITIK